MLITIYLKNGAVLPEFKCDSFTTETSISTGAIVGWEAHQASGAYPLYVDATQIAAIISDDDPDELTNQDDRVKELEAELARAMFYLSAQKDCDTCKHGEAPGRTACLMDCADCYHDDCKCRGCAEGRNWEWMGSHGNE